MEDRTFNYQELAETVEDSGQLRHQRPTRATLSGRGFGGWATRLGRLKVPFDKGLLGEPVVCVKDTKALRRCTLCEGIC